MAERPRVAVIFTGGTISMLPDPLTGAAVPALDGAGILARVPELDDIADVEAIDWGSVPASHLRFSQLREISRLVEAQSRRAEIDGVVVVQGTDVLEETAFYWDLLHANPKPVVVVGAMRNAGQPDYDGPANLIDAVVCAAAPELRDQGVVVVMAGAVLPADDVTKTDTAALDTFHALDAGPLGSVRERRVSIDRRRSDRRLVAEPRHEEPRVTLLTAVVSTDGDLLRAAVGQGARGIVVAATGSGNTDPDLLAAAVEAMRVGVPVVLVTRCASGSVGPLYGFAGGGADWQRSGAIMGGTLSGPRARIALALGLAAELPDQELRSLLER